MPIFQDDLGRSRRSLQVKPMAVRRSTSPEGGSLMERKLSEESVRTELCEGPIPDMPEDERSFPTAGLASDFQFLDNGMSDRPELIGNLQRDESPAWLPSYNLESLLQDYGPTLQKSVPSTSNSSLLLASPELPCTKRSSTIDRQRNQDGLQILRPRSALHSGDFTEGAGLSHNNGLLQPNLSLPRSEQAPWLATSPPLYPSPFQIDPRIPPPDRADGTRSRAPSLSTSYSSSFILKPPTSPLVQSESNDDLDLTSDLNPIDTTPSFQRNTRRLTFQASESVHSTPTSTTLNRPLPHLRRDSAFPYQAHQPRRSLTSSQIPHPSVSPQTPQFSRRLSYTPDSLSLHHASMVGSYEESILRGRMSTTPSKPLDFVAQIGVLGLGKCKSSLRCPSHVTVPFPAVFYSYGTTSHGRIAKSEDGPSPYVGQIDLENSLFNPDEARGSKRRPANTNTRNASGGELAMVDGLSSSNITKSEARKTGKQKRRSTSPRAPPGGSYRIPEKGQLQIIIKNPNKTAVKLFLVPYDLSGMEPETKTFIRQRSYSAGPIIDMPITAVHQNSMSNSSERSTLRYLVHLHICSPSRGRFYLYKSIRVVFANRVPDGKEKLRNEVSLPEPRFSAYKPHSSLGLTNSGGAGANLTAEKAYRRRSSGFPLDISNRAFDPMSGTSSALEKDFGSGAPFEHARGSNIAPVRPIPFSLGGSSQRDHNTCLGSIAGVQSLSSGKSSQPPISTVSLSDSWNSDSTELGGYGKLNKGDAGYGASLLGGLPDGKLTAEGLLAKKLKYLGLGLNHLQDDVDDK
ncbi:hypothetical protein QTJ16_001253 [Diplocarpon rosae]|uniref:Atos-like conserved domain-containing protein n=1 Tax=Diplocarpon rosae TaxID=946125 RepID=A0AAD9T7J7_9HELO|nr:hypothetical protein QTJ16_001253 [Diplocarpon rosae]